MAQNTARTALSQLPRTAAQPAQSGTAGRRGEPVRADQPGTRSQLGASGAAGQSGRLGQLGASGATDQAGTQGQLGPSGPAGQQGRSRPTGPWGQPGPVQRPGSWPQGQGEALPAAIPVAVIGAGQAGLAAGYFLRRAGVPHVLLDSAAELGAVWRGRWDSLRMFTSAQFSSLPGLPFPGPGARYPGKDEVAEYLRRYAERFELPVLLGHRVLAVRREDGAFLLKTDRGDCRAEQVVIAAGAYGAPTLPPVAQSLTPAVPQWHASDYRNPGAVPAGTVLVVGTGNSGVQIARELSASHQVLLSEGTRQPEVPQRVLGRDIFWWMSVMGLMDMALPPGAPDPIVGNRIAELTGPGGAVRLVGRVTGATGEELTLADGVRLRPDAVIWATGYRHDWGWLAPEFLDEAGQPRHTGGVGAVPGSYFVGLYRMRTRGSALLGFVGRDAEGIVAHLVDAR